MPLALPRILCRSNCVLILVMSHLASTTPLRSRRRTPASSLESERGFSAMPRVLEIQLPLKIASREDLLAWSRYVTNLVTARINRTSAPPRDPPTLATQRERTRLSVANVVSGPYVKSKEMSSSFGEKRPGLNYPARRLKEPPAPSPDDMVVAYPLPVGDFKPSTHTPPLPSNNFGLATPGVPAGLFDQQQLYQGHYAHLNFGEPFQPGAFNVVGGPESALAHLPASAYLPLPPTTADFATYPHAIQGNVSEFREPTRQPSMRNTLNYRAKDAEDVVGRAPSPNDVGNLSRLAEPLLTFPFQAVITITRQLPDAKDPPRTRPKDHRAKVRPEEHLARNFTLTNISGRPNAFFDDLAAETERNESSRPEDEEVEEEQEDERQRAKEERKKSNGKKKKVSSKQQKSRKRQSSILGDLLRMLGLLKKLPKNSTEVSVAVPVLSILKGTNSQKITVAFDEETPGRGRRNETTHESQELDDDDDDDNNGNGDDNNDDNNDDDKKAERQEDDDEEEGGGSVQALLDLLPLAAPILEELSDPESDVNIVELLQGALPLLEGLSDPEEDGFDIPGILVPLSQRLSEGPEGEGSDSGAILGPLIQLIAPLIGPIVGPLIGPLSRTSSGPDGKKDSASFITALAGPLSEPGADGQSVLSGLVAGITAKLSKESAASAGDSDVKSLVSALVSGVLAGASAGSSGSKGQKDTYYAPTTYGGYGGYGSHGSYGSYPSPKDMLSMAVKQILAAFLKLSATSSTSSANLSGASSSSSAGLSASSSESKEPPKYPPYGVHHPPYAKPDYYATPGLRPPATDSSYVMFARREQIKKT